MVDRYQDFQWLPKTADSPKSYIYYIFFYTYMTALVSFSFCDKIPILIT